MRELRPIFCLPVDLVGVLKLLWADVPRTKIATSSIKPDAMDFSWGLVQALIKSDL